MATAPWINGTEGVIGKNGTGPMRRKAVAMKQFPRTENIVGYRILSQIWKYRQILIWAAFSNSGLYGFILFPLTFIEVF